ncbi:MAG: Ku protein [Gemmatimonadota bacterium]
MTARPMASATISFGLVSIPVKLYAATESSRKVGFNLIHRACGSRVKRQYVCPKEETPVAQDDLVKGYEFAKGQYVLFESEELKALEEEATQRLEIAEFVPLKQVERIYIDRFYYLGPDKGGDHAYGLLREAMTRTGWAALAKYAARGKQYLVLIRPMDGRLVMEQLHYAEEIRSIEEVPLEESEVKKSELELAVQLIEQIATQAFEPQKYEDEVGQRMLAAIQEKVDGKEISVAPAVEPETQVIDLMEALKKSLAEAGSTGGKSARRRKGARKKAAR